jgi:hypothetical protein
VVIGAAGNIAEASSKAFVQGSMSELHEFVVHVTAALPRDA